ncbi:MAG: aldo/keto reductase [Myxococcota bacterium]
MKLRALGKTGIKVSEIGFGAWALGGDLWGGQDEADSVAALDRAFELGVQFLDTALVYGRGRSESVIGGWIKKKKIREQVVIASKIPPANLAWPARTGVPIASVFPAAHLRSCTEKSLRNLGVDTIDLMQLHVWTDAFTDDDGWWEAMSALKKEGKIRAIGVSINSFEPESALRLVRSGRVEALQVYHNVFEQRPEDELLPLAKAEGVGIISRVPLDESALTGKLTKKTEFASGDYRSMYFRGDRLAQAVDRVEALRPVLEKAAGSMVSGALRYCLSSDAVSTVIPGIRNRAQAEANTAASDAGKLTAAVLKTLRKHRWDRDPREWSI